MNSQLPPQALLALLQVTDSLAPIGAFAQSYGLEGLVQQGSLRGGRDLAECLDGLIRHTLATADLVGVIQAHRAATAGELDRLSELDEIVSALKVAREAREASLGLGRRLLTNAALLAHAPLLDEYRAQLAERLAVGRAGGHHCVVYAVVSQALGIAEQPAALGYGYSFASGVVSAALRLGIVGQREAQTILRGQWPALEAVAAQAGSIPPEDMSAFAPAIEIAMMRHERAPARLFAS